MTPTEKLTTITRIIFIGFIGALVFHTTMRFIGYGFPLNTFLFLSHDRFADFFSVYDTTTDLDPYFSEIHRLGIYLPLSYLIFIPFTWTSKFYAIMIYSLIFCVFIYWYTQHQLKLQNKILPLFIFLSFPVLFCLDRGNLDNLVFIITAIAIINFINKKYYLSSFLIGIAAGMKIYPFILITLLIKEKRWRECLLCILTFILLNLFAITLFKTNGISHTIHHYLELLFFVNKNIDLTLNFSSSLLSFIKICIWYLPPFNHDYSKLFYYHHIMANVLKVYLLFSLIASACIAAYVIFIEQIRWKQIMLLTIAMIIFPYMSSDYKLIFLLIPLYLFITEKNPDAYNKIYTILFALLLIPKNYFFFKGPTFYFYPDYAIYSIMDFINMLIMLTFIAIIMLAPTNREQKLL